MRDAAGEANEAATELEDAPVSASAVAAKQTAKTAARGRQQGGRGGSAARDGAPHAASSGGTRGRMLAYRGSMDLRVARVGAAKRALLSAIAALGGYPARVIVEGAGDGDSAADGSYEPSGGTSRYAEVEAHVPSERLHAVRAAHSPTQRPSRRAL